MLVVISSEAPKKRKIYHKMGCIYAERIKFQNLLEIKVEQAEKEGYCECKYCAGLRGDVRTHKAQILSWTHKKEMEFKFDDHTETLYIKTKIGFWKIYLKDDITEQQIENIKNKIIEESDNTEIEYVSKEKALERFKNNLEKNENLLNDFDNQNNTIPASIEIKTDTKIQTIVESIQDMQGIAHITTHINSNPYELYIQRVMKK